jgi:hypothetical protein
MTNEDPRIAPLRRKMAATQEPAKAAELAVVLRGLGFDPDAAEEVSAAPKGRSAPKRETTEDTRTKDTDEKRRPARPAATSASKPAPRAPARPKGAK